MFSGENTNPFGFSFLRHFLIFEKSPLPFTPTLLLLTLNHSPCILRKLGWAKLGWNWLGCSWLYRAGLGWSGLVWAVLGWVVLGRASLCWAVLGRAGLGWAVLGYSGLMSFGHLVILLFSHFVIFVIWA